jgi:hypothetical protein
MEKRLKNIQTFEQHSSELNISDVSDSNLFFAEEGEVKLEIEESFLIDRNIDLLLRKLRRKGFSNLTGNFERKEIIKHNDVYILELTRDKKGGFINNKQQVVFYKK